MEDNLIKAQVLVYFCELQKFHLFISLKIIENILHRKSMFVFS